MKKVNKVRVRFAPSPTGYLHVGNVRTALFNFLFAKNRDGKFILRIEDTDLERSKREFEDALIKDLEWLGIKWDEGFIVGGDFGPYRQTERLDIYKKYAEKLINEGKAYYCFCSKEELEKEREKQKRMGKIPKYSGKCRNIPIDEALNRIKNGEKAVVRLKVPKNHKIIFEDAVFGHQEIDSSQVDDRVLLRSDGTPTYNFACVVDDYEMKITHILRGEQHLSNTPLQALIYEMIGIKPPVFAHLSTINGPDGKKLSKRHGATSILEFREKGYLPEAMVNYLSLLGWSPPDEKEIMTLNEIISKFSLERVSKSPAIFDIKKLNWVNREHMKMIDKKRLVQLSIPYFKNFDIFNEVDEKIEKFVELILDGFLNHIDYLSQIVYESQMIFKFNLENLNVDEEVKKILGKEESKVVISCFYDKIKDIEYLDFESYKNAVLGCMKELGIKGKNLFHPIRVGITALSSGPEIEKLIEIIEYGRKCNLNVEILPVKERVRRVLERL